MIDEMTTEEKSVMLARLCGWETRNNSPDKDIRWTEINTPNGGYDKNIPVWRLVYRDGNLYDPSNMALLAKVLKCLNDKFGWQWRGEALDSVDFDDLHTWMCQCVDYGLQLALKAGLVAIE